MDFSDGAEVGHNVADADDIAPLSSVSTTGAAAEELQGDDREPPVAMQDSSKWLGNEVAAAAPPLDLLSLPLNEIGREAVTSWLFQRPLNEGEQNALLQHTVIADRYVLRLLTNDDALVSLDLSHSLCTDVAMIALTDGIRRNSSLTTLVLDGNPIGDASLFLLAEALARNTSLTALSVRNANVTDVGVQLLAAALEQNDHLVQCDVDALAVAPHIALSNLLRVNRYAAKGAVVKEVYRRSNTRSTLQESSTIATTVAHADPSRNAVRVDLSHHHPSSAEDVAQDGSQLVVDAWLLEFLCATLTAWSYSPLQPLVEVALDLSGNAAVGDECVDAIVRCCRAPMSRTHRHDHHQEADDEGAHFTSIRFSCIDLSKTSISNRSIDALSQVLKEETEIIARSCASLVTAHRTVPVIAQLVLNDCANAPPETTAQLLWAMSLRDEPISVRRAALRLRQNDPTFLHADLRAEGDEAGSNNIHDHSMQILLPELLQNTTLISLTVAQAHLSALSAQVVGQLLQHTSFLQVLDLKGNVELCRGGAAQSIANGLESSTVILSLNLAATSVDAPGAVALVNALKRNRSLTVLDLSNNPDICGSDVEEEMLAVFGTVNRVLQRVSLDSTGLADGVVKAVGLAIREAHEPPFLQAVLGQLSSSASGHLISSVDLRGSSVQVLRDSSMELLAEAIRGRSAVTHLDISHNGITVDGMKLLLESVGSDPASRLHSMDVSYNPVYDGLEFAQAVVELLLRRHSTLALLRVCGTDLYSVGVQCIVDALAEISFPATIQQIDATDNKASGDVMTALEVLTRSNRVDATTRAFVKETFRVVRASNAMPKPLQISCVNAKGLNASGSSATASDLVVLLCSTLLLSLAGCKRLILSRNLLDEACARLLTKYLAEGLPVAEMDLSDNVLNDNGVDQLIAGMLRSNALRNVALRNNPDVSASRLAAVEETLKLCRQPPFLKSTLSEFCRDPRLVRHRDGGGGEEDEGSRGDASPDADDVVLQRLDFSQRLCDHITDERLRLLCDALESQPHAAITQIVLSNNHVSNASLKRLIHFTTTGPAHRSKFLEGMSFRNTLVRGAEAALHCVELFERLPSLIAVDLSENELQPPQPKFPQPVHEVPYFETVALPRIVALLEEKDQILHFNLSNCGLAEVAMDSVQALLEANRAELKPTLRLLRENSSALVSLCLSDMNLTIRVIRLVINALRDNTTLRDLDLSGNGITADGGHVIIQWIAGEHPASPTFRLEGLLLDDNHLSDEHATPLFSALQKNTTLRTLSLLHNDMSSVCVEEVFVRDRTLFDTNPTLCEFLMDSGDIDAFAFERFSQRFVLNAPALRCVKAMLHRLHQDDADLSVVDLSSTDGFLCDEVCYELADVLVHNTTVKELILSHGDIGDEGVLALCRALVINRSVVQIDLSFNDITDVGVTALLDVLTVNSIVTSIALQGNPQMGELSLCKLQSVLLLNHSVIAVELESSRFAAPSVEKVDRGVLLNQSHPSLKQFLLSEGEETWTALDVSNSAALGKTFGDEACKVLAERLKTNRALEALDISCNQLGFDAASYLSEMLEVNCALTSLNLSHNSLQTSVVHFTRALKVNAFLIDLNLSDTMASDMFLNTIQLLVATNRETEELKSEALALLDDASGHRHLVIRGLSPDTFDLRRPRRRKLYLDDDSMETLGAVMDLSTAIQHVTLVDHRITSSGLRWLAMHIFPGHQNISTLILTNNRLDDEAVAILTDVCALPLLRTVNVSQNCLTDSCLPTATRLLESSPGLEYCQFRPNRGMSEETLQQLEFLELLNRHSSPDARKHLLQLWRNDASTVVANFDDYRGEGRQRMSEMYAKLIAFALRDNDHVTTLSLNRCEIDDELLGLLCHHVLRRSRSVVEISLCENLITDVDELVEFVLSAEGLPITALRLTDNHMVLKSARSLATLLRNSRSLKTLEVANNKWGRTGAVLVQSALSSSDTVQRITLKGPGIPSSVAAAAEFAVLHNRTKTPEH